MAITLVSTTEKPTALRRGLSDQWRTPPPDDDEEQESGGGEVEVSSDGQRKYVNGATTLYPDFHDAMKNSDRAGHEIKDPGVQRAILRLPDADKAHVLYHLSTHPREIMKLNKLSREAGVAHIHVLLAQAKQLHGSAQDVPSPPNEELEKMAPKDFNAIRDKQEAAKRGRRRV